MYNRVDQFKIAFYLVVIGLVIKVVDFDGL